MSGNSRRGFLRELAAAAAKAGAQRAPQAPPPEEPAPEGLEYDPPAPPLDPGELVSDPAPYMPPAIPLDPPDADDDGGLGLTAIELARYERQLVLPEWSGAAQLSVGDASVLVVGAGALGSPVAMYLAGAGVGRLGILDDDAVELSNLHRQLLHFTPDVGSPKAQSAASKLRFLNPDVIIESYQARFGPENAAALLEGQDLVVDCADTFESRYLVNAACCAARVPLVEAGVSGFSGLVMAIRPGETACYRCLFPTPPRDAPSCAEAGVLGPAAGVVGSLQALEALRLLGGLPGGLEDGFLQIDLLAHDYLRVSARRRPDCPDCGDLYS